MLLVIDKGRLLKTAGWTAIGLGLYLITVGTSYDGDFTTRQPDDGVIDADFTIIDD